MEITESQVLSFAEDPRANGKRWCTGLLGNHEVSVYIVSKACRPDAWDIYVDMKRVDRHPQIATVIDLREDDTHFYFVTERCVGTLDEFLQEHRSNIFWDAAGRMTPSLLSVVRDILSAMYYLHTHRRALNLDVVDILVDQIHGRTEARIWPVFIGNMDSSPKEMTSRMRTLGELLELVIFYGNVEAKMAMNPESRSFLKIFSNPKCDFTRLWDAVYKHPIFWDEERCLDFFVDIRSILKHKSTGRDAFKDDLLALKDDVIGPYSWEGFLPEQYRRRFRGQYNYYKTTGLIKMLRDTKCHPENGELEEAFGYNRQLIGVIRRSFPCLLCKMYETARDDGYVSRLPGFKARFL